MMRPTFELDISGQPSSIIGQIHVPHAITKGMRFELTKDYWTPYGLVNAGAKGFVEMVDEDEGTVWVLMEGMEPALIHWDNRMVLSPFNTDDTLDGLAFGRPITQAKLSLPGSSAFVGAGIVFAVAAAALVVGFGDPWLGIPIVLAGWFFGSEASLSLTAVFPFAHDFMADGRFDFAALTPEELARYAFWFVLAVGVLWFRSQWPRLKQRD
jgi:hypothetical protein